MEHMYIGAEAMRWAFIYILFASYDLFLDYKQIQVRT